MIIDAKVVRSMCPSRSETGHKGDFGTALIVAGSEYMPGAQTLAVSAALRSGVGMVRVLAPRSSYISTSVNCPCALLSPYPDSVAALLREARGLLSRSKAVLIGPGIDTNDIRNKALVELALTSSAATVLDAGGLTLLAEYAEEFFPLLRTRTAAGYSRVIITPHIGEMRRLIKAQRRVIANENGGEDAAEESRITSQTDIVRAAREFSRRLDCIVVLKDAVTTVICPDGEEYISHVTNSGMSKGGSGDVLAGLLTGFLAQGMKPPDAAVSAVYFHSFAGGVAAGEIGRRAMLPTDIIENLSYAYETAGWK